MEHLYNALLLNSNLLGGREKIINVSIPDSYFRGAIGALMVYDITSLRSFKRVAVWLSELGAHADPDIVVVLVGNKCDDKHHRSVSIEEGRAYAGTFYQYSLQLEKYGLFFIETSALSGNNVKEAFELILMEQCKKNSKGPDAGAMRRPVSFPPRPDDAENKSNCICC
jgi:GTPase SAR1 family protein